MGNFCPKSKDNEIELLKEFKDENYFPIESVPNEIMVKFFSYLDENGKVNVSLVNKRWFQVANNEIKNLSIKWPQQQNQDVQNLMNRFSKLKSLEFDIDPDMIPTKSNYSTSITRIRINSPKEKIIGYKKSQIISFAVEMPNPKDFDSVLEEILSLDNVSK